MAYTNKEKEILRMSTEELRRTFDHVCNIFDQLRLKALALIAGEVAIVSFIFGSEDNRFEIPTSGDRLIFFGVAAISLIAAFSLLLWILSTVTWKFPHDIAKATTILKKSHSNDDEYREYLHDDLVKDINHNFGIVAPRLKKFNWSVYLLSAGAIILLVLKYGGMNQ